MSEILEQLVAMSRRLGEPANDYVILGEGNTSALEEADWFWVKASGASLCGIERAGFVKVHRPAVLEMLEAPSLTDTQVKELLADASASAGGPRPSVETMFHAYLLGLPGVRFVGHTHPTAVNAITCSKASREIVSGRLFPDEIVCLGRAPAYVPYVDPGLTLSKAVRQAVEEYIEREGERPRMVLMENHGLIALGGTPQEVEAVTAMAVKTARVLAGTYTFGGPRYLTEKNVDRIHTRPDEAYRKQALMGRGKA